MRADVFPTLLVVEPSACDDVAGGPVCAGHHPRRRHRHRVLLVRRERVPHDQLPVLGFKKMDQRLRDFCFEDEPAKRRRGGACRWTSPGRGPSRCDP